MTVRCLLRKGEILDRWKEGESKRESTREEKRCMCMISKADIRTPIRGQCASLLLVERAGVRKSTEESKSKSGESN